MNWEKLADVDILQLERNEALLDSLYTFLEENELSSAEAARAEPSQLSKMLAVVQWVMKVKKIANFSKVHFSAIFSVCFR